MAQGFLLDLLDRNGQLLPLGAPPGKSRSPGPVRLVSASKRPLSFSALRADLCERLAEGHLFTVPALEDRVDDIPGLIDAFLRELREESDIDAMLTDEAIRFAQVQPWPGQIRELRAAVRAVVFAAQAERQRAGLSRGRVVLRAASLAERMIARQVAFLGREGHDPGASRATLGANPNPPDEPPADGRLPAVTSIFRAPALPSDLRTVNPRALTRGDLEAALRDRGGNRTLAAQRLGIARNTLLKKIRLWCPETR